MPPLIVANWKMELSDTDAIDTARRLAETIPSGVEVVICPSFTVLASIAEAIRGSAVALGAQDCAVEDRGALTGEVSPSDLAHLGCRYVIVGHSERRQQLNESNAVIARKLRAALHVGLQPILCVGETMDERAAGKRDAVLERQLGSALEKVELSGSQGFCVAYEPAWAIGSGEPATPADVAVVQERIQSIAQQRLGDDGVARIRFIYGGSVGPDNITAFLARPEIAGVLVGTASQTAARLRAIVAAVRC
ncbi:MAG: triose-phosphate isomerase [Candidatus Uhrbacteria bacterium]